MTNIKHSDINIDCYPKGTGRLKIIGEEGQSEIKVALCGDSTIDNGYWVDRGTKYIEKTHTIAQQIALHLDKDGRSKKYLLANFAVDGATTGSMLTKQRFDEVIPEDKDHPKNEVAQLNKIKEWSPDVAVLSIGGNNYRVAFQSVLPKLFFPEFNIFSFLSVMFRFTPRLTKALGTRLMYQFFPEKVVMEWQIFNELVDAVKNKWTICKKKNKDEVITNKDYKDLISDLSWKASSRKLIEVYFKITQEALHKEYKEIIDGLVENGTTKRLVISSQYYPALTPATPYFIYSGFAHLAHSKGQGQSPFQVADEILHEFYREVLSYAAEKNIEIVFADVTSSMSPLGGYLSFQIEPNERGSALLGKLMAQAIELEIPEEKIDSIPVIRLNKQQELEISYLEKSNIQSDFKMKSVEDFIQQDRYRHIQLLFAKDTPYFDKFIYFNEFLFGKQFDNEYTGLYAFGLLDLTLATIAASYLWRVAVNEQMHISLRLLSGLISVPILMAKYLVVIAFLLALFLAFVLTVIIWNTMILLMRNFISPMHSFFLRCYKTLSSTSKEVSSSLQDSETAGRNENIGLFACKLTNEEIDRQGELCNP